MSLKRESGAAFLAQRDGVSKAPKPSMDFRRMLGPAGFAESLRAEAEAKADRAFDALMASPCAGGIVGATARVDGVSTDKTAQPKCSWWQLQSGCPPIGPVESARLDLSKIDGEVGVVAITAEVTGSNKEKVRGGGVAEDTSTSLKTQPPWIAVVMEGDPKDPQQLLRIRRAEGVENGSVWLVGVFIRSAEDSAKWQAEAIDEVYPATRLKKLLPLRCKDLVPPAPEKEAEDPMEATRRMLAEAMGAK